MMGKTILANAGDSYRANGRLGRSLRNFGVAPEDVEGTIEIIALLTGVFMAFCAIMNYDWYFESKWGIGGAFTFRRFGRKVARVVNIITGFCLILVACYLMFA